MHPPSSILLYTSILPLGDFIHSLHFHVEDFQFPALISVLFSEFQTHVFTSYWTAHVLMLDVVFYLRTADLSLFLYYSSWSMIWPSTQLPIPGSSKSASFLTTYTNWSPDFVYSTTQVCLRFFPPHHPWSRLSWSGITNATDGMA